MKSALRRLLVTALCLWTVQVFAAQGLVYRIVGDGGRDSFLVGTMHSEDPRVVALLDQFKPLIERVDTVAVEMLPDGITLLAIGAASMLPADQRLSDMIGAQRFSALTVAAGRIGIPAEVLDRMRPWAAAVTLGMPASDSGRFLDMEIYLHALAQRRKTVGLETAAEQLAVFQGMAYETQILLLDAMIKNADDLPTQLEMLTTTFLSGELAELDRVARDQYQGMPADVIDWFDRALIDERNARMLTRMQPILEQGAVLVAVGALHLGGRNGLVEGLRGLGYDVRRWPD